MCLIKNLGNHIIKCLRHVHSITQGVQFWQELKLKFIFLLNSDNFEEKKTLKIY
jgi:hypothetical protein